MMSKLHVETTMNGQPVEFLCTGSETLLDALRNTIGLTGTKEGCATGDCGACSVILNGRLVPSCLVLAPEAQGQSITTIEGIAEGERLHPLQQKFLEHAALQCGIDTSAAEALPGVQAVVTARDIPPNSAKVLLGGEAALDLGDMSDCMLAREKVMYHGHAVAAVAATSLDIAREAANRIKVVYDVLPPVTGIDQAIAPGAPQLHQSFANNVANRMEFKRGDVGGRSGDAHGAVVR